MQVGNSDSVSKRWVREVLQEYSDVEAPVTENLVSIIIGIFIAKVVLTHIYQIQSIQILVEWIFIEYPEAAWALSPLLHKDFPHFISNVFGLVVTGYAIERHLDRSRYIVFLIISGYFSIIIGAGVVLLFSDQKIAFYGASGIVFALSGYALAHIFWRHIALSRTEWLAIVAGVAALFVTFLDFFTPPYLDPSWINGAHLGGFLIGILFGRIGWGSCKFGWVSTRKK